MSFVNRRNTSGDYHFRELVLFPSLGRQISTLLPPLLEQGVALPSQSTEWNQFLKSGTGKVVPVLN
jgi:hypothetical protein